MTNLEREIVRIKASDALKALDHVNVAQLPTETYAENVERRAKLNVMRDELLALLTGL